MYYNIIIWNWLIAQRNKYKIAKTGRYPIIMYAYLHDSSEFDHGIMYNFIVCIRIGS